MARKRKKKATSTEMCCGPSPADERKWKIRSAYSDLERAEEVRSDPSLMADVRKFAAKEAKRAARIAKMEKKDVTV